VLRVCICFRVSLGIYASGCEWAGSGVKHASCAEQKMQGACTCCVCVYVSVFLWVFMPQGVNGLAVVEDTEGRCMEELHNVLVPNVPITCLTCCLPCRLTCVVCIEGSFCGPATHHNAL